MPLYMDVQTIDGGLGAKDGADPPMKDLEAQATTGGAMSAVGRPGVSRRLSMGTLEFRLRRSEIEPAV